MEKTGKRRIKPSSFFTNEPPERIVGVECEYNIQNTISETKKPDISEYISQQAMESAGIQSIRGYTDNGYRIYSDMGHAECCTPECLGPYQAAAADLAGIAIMSSIIEASGVDHNGVYRVSGTWPSGNTNTTSGLHENFMAPASIAYSLLLKSLLPTYYATRLGTMAGTIVDNQFRFSQKIHGIGGDPLSWRTDGRRTAHSNKPMALLLSNDIDTIDSGWLRLETRFADGPISLESRRHALATTSLILRMIENEELFMGDKPKDIGNFDDIIIVRPLEAAQKFMSDLSLKSTVLVESGKRMTMLDIQEQLAKNVLYLCDRVNLPSDEVTAANKWPEIYDAFRRSNPLKAEYDRYLLYDFGVASKHSWLTHKKDAFTKGDLEAKTRSLQWDRVIPRGNALSLLEKTCDDPQIEVLKRSAPNTRAKLRSNFISNNDSAEDIGYLNWRYVKKDGIERNFGDAFGTIN